MKRKKKHQQNKKMEKRKRKRKRVKRTKGTVCSRFREEKKEKTLLPGKTGKVSKKGRLDLLSSI